MTAVHHFELADLEVAHSALGQAFPVDYEGHHCTLRLPADLGDFETADSPVDLPVLGGFLDRDGVLVRAAIRMVRVEVEMPGELTADQVPRGGPALPDALEEALCLLRDSAELARRLVASFSTQARTRKNQFWLSPTAFQLPQLTWMSNLYDVTGQRLGVGFGQTTVVHMPPPNDAALEHQEIASLLQIATTGEQPLLPESLLADARFYVFRANQPNPRLGLILAAVACEVKVKQRLYDLADKSQKPLVDLLVAHPRDYSLAAASLFDKGLAAVAGRSLRMEDKALYKKVEGLFEHRNGFAHRGDPGISTEQVHADIATAVVAFEWLDSFGPR